MSHGFPSDEQAALSPREIVALADEMNTAGFPEIAEILVGLAYEIADRWEGAELSARVLDRDWPAEALSGWLRG
jgi:hypothetical protein